MSIRKRVRAAWTALTQPERLNPAPAPLARPPQGFAIREHDVFLETIPFINTVQIQPSAMRLDGADFVERSRLFETIMSWLLGSADLARIGGGDLPPPPAVPQPLRPWLLCLPEAYLPYESLLAVAEQQLEPGSIILAGISPAGEHGAAQPLFDLAAVDRLAARIRSSGVHFRNEIVLDETRALLHGEGRANLAATLAVDHERKTNLILHTKLTRSKFERGLDPDANTVEGLALDTVVLRSKQPPNGRVVIMPLICADFSTPNPYSGGRIALQRWADECERPVDLVCVLNLQPCRTRATVQTPLVPWPDDVAQVIVNLGRRRYGYHLEKAHTLLTNIGQFNDRPGGHSCFAITGDPFDVLSDAGKIAAYRDALAVFEGRSITYARANVSGELNGSHEQWLDLRQRLPKAIEQPTSTLLLLEGPPFDCRALGLQIRCELNKKVGLGAISRARSFVVRNDDTFAPARAK